MAVRPRFWVAFGALALALAFLAPALTPLSGSMDAFSKDLSNGTFRPFGRIGPAPGPSTTYSGTLGGLTGDSPGNYLPGASQLPRAWTMDRDGRGGRVVIDEVFDPGLGAMKRLKAYDRVASNGETLEVADTRVVTVSGGPPDPTLTYDLRFEAGFAVSFHPGELVPIFSPHPKAILQSFRTSPAVPGGVTFFRDGADTLYARATVERVVTLNLTFAVPSDYFSLGSDRAWRVQDYRYGPLLPRPVVPAQQQEEAKVVLARAGVADPDDVMGTLEALSRYFRSFTEGDIPPPSELESTYLALALGEHGCCRHRAFAFLVTAQAVGIPTRVVVNEAHAFVEVALPDGHWHQINLGGCGTYEVNDPNDVESFFDQAEDPRAEANPDEGSVVRRVLTVTNVTESPARIVKGERYFVNGTVQFTDGRGVAGARVDVYLNETKTTPGKLTGAGVTRPDGTFSVEALVPAAVTARGYQLVARATDGGLGTVRYEQSWSDPPVEVYAPTRILVPAVVAAAGFPAAVAGRLADVDGNGVPQAVVEWTADGAAQPPLRTDASGRFTGNVTFATPGTHALRFGFAGTEHHGPSTLDVTVRVGQGAILFPAEPPTLLRGEPGNLTGRVASQGAQVDGRLVTATPSFPLAARRLEGATMVLLQAETTTRGDGTFTLAVAPSNETPPGVYEVRYGVAALNLTGTQTVRVLAKPVLDVSAPGRVHPREAWVVEARVRSDNGTQLAGALVELTLDGNATTTRQLLANRTGVVRFELEPGDLGEGAHALVVRFPGDAAHGEAREAVAVEVVAPWRVAGPAWVWALLLALPLAALLLFPLLRAGGPLRTAWSRAAAALSRPERRVLALSFPDHPARVAPVFEPGETARVRVALTDRERRPVAGRVALSAGPRRFVAHATPVAGAIVAVPLAAEGTVRVRATATGLARLWTRPVEVLLPVTSYRRAVEDGFVALRRRADLPASATPGDLVARLGPRLPEAKRADLRRAASLFNEADYSETPVDRAYYHAFARAAASVLDDVKEARDARA